MSTMMCRAKQDNVKKTNSSTRQYLEQRIVVSEVVLSMIIYSARQDKMMLWWNRILSSEIWGMKRSMMLACTIMYNLRQDNVMKKHNSMSESGKLKCVYCCKYLCRLKESKWKTNVLTPAQPQIIIHRKIISSYGITLLFSNWWKRDEKKQKKVEVQALKMKMILSIIFLFEILKKDFIRIWETSLSSSALDWEFICLFKVTPNIIFAVHLNTV